MKDKCPFQDHVLCNNWMDYQLLQYTLMEAEELADENWKEIQHLYDYIDRLKTTLENADIPIPPEYL